MISLGFVLIVGVSFAQVSLRFKNCRSCSTCLKIDSETIKDDEKEAIEKYVYARMLDIDTDKMADCKLEIDQINQLYKSSFFKNVLVKIAQSDYQVESLEIVDYLNSRELDLFFNIKNEAFLYLVTDTLLYLNNGFTLSVLWGRLNIDRLDYFDQYCDAVKTSDNIFKYSNLIANLHFSNENNQYTVLINELYSEALKIDGFEEEKVKLKSVLESKEMDYTEYHSLMYVF